MKYILFICVLSTILNFSSHQHVAHANEKEQRLSIKEICKKLGYKQMEDALQDCEQHFHQKIPIPTKLPYLSFTHLIQRAL
jgi:hypothetical protein